MAARQHGIATDSATNFTKTGSYARSRSGSRSTSGSRSGSRSSSTGSLQWSVKRRALYSAMAEEERCLFDELQAEIGELRHLLAATDGTGKSKVRMYFVSQCFRLSRLASTRTQSGISKEIYCQSFCLNSIELRQLVNSVFLNLGVIVNRLLFLLVGLGIATAFIFSQHRI